MIDLINRIESIGVCREKLRVVLDSELFDSLSKHNTNWESEHEREADLLEGVRLKLAWLDGELWDIMTALAPMEHPSDPRFG